MHSTRASRSLKKLFAGYHEPTPLSQQQSHSLLDGLKSSFRDQLDREYGSSASSPATMSRPSRGAEASPITRQSAANQHLKSLLSNPLFSYEKETGSTLPSPTPSLKRDPMDVFDHAVSRGMMTLKAATGCLMAKHQQLQLLPDVSSRVTGTDTALRIVRWLRSSRPDTDLSFLNKTSFVKALMPFLVSEGLDHITWEWVSRTVNDTSGVWGDEERYQRASLLLVELVRVKSQPQYGNLDAAITTLLEAEKSFHTNPLLAKMLLLPWRSVSWLSTVESYSRTAPSEQLFDAHVAAAHSLRTPVDVEKAHLHLYHPTHPDHSAALRLFENKQKVRRLVQGITPEKISIAKSNSLGILQWIAVLGHDTVNFLTRSGRSQEAEHVKALLQAELASLFTHPLKPA